MIRKYPPAKRPCQRCQTLFTPIWRGPRYYCSDACRNAGPRLLKMAHFERVYPARECETCKQTFTPTCARQMYCCRDCRYVGQRAQRLTDILMRHQGAKAS